LVQDNLVELREYRIENFESFGVSLAAVGFDVFAQGTENLKEG
jgi:hypothetical protein